jgi:hypothetical protein
MLYISAMYKGCLLTFVARCTSGNFADESKSLLADNVHNEMESQVMGSVENFDRIHVGTLRTGGRGSNLPFEAGLQEHLQFH